MPDEGRFAYSHTMRDKESARTTVRDLPDGRVEVKINHQRLAGVTSTMLVWWFHTFPDPPDAVRDDLDTRRTAIVNGVRVPLYYLWHPEDHIQVQIVRPAPSGDPGLSQGARAVLTERWDGHDFVAAARCDGMDEDGIHLVGSKGPFQVLDLRHAFTDTADGLVYKTRILLGNTAPLVGRAITAAIRRDVASPESLDAVLRHNIAEVGNFEVFLPPLYAQRDEAIPELEF